MAKTPITYVAVLGTTISPYLFFWQAAQAAEALRPIAGEFAFAIFSFGIIGTGLLAVPVLAGSAAFAVSDVFGWKSGLSQGFHEARGFYAIIIAATAIGTGMGLMKVDPIKALVWSAIINGVISVPIMMVMMHIGQSESLMSEKPKHTVPTFPLPGSFYQVARR